MARQRDEVRIDREKRILDYMKREIREKGYPPTVREICAALNIKSTSTCHKDIASLEEQGFLKKDPARPRALLVVDDDFDQMAAVRSASNAGFAGHQEGMTDFRSFNGRIPSANSMNDGLERADVVDVPMVGRIAAGTPILAEQNIEDSFPIPARFVGSGTTFMLTVKGESMIEAGIMDGDYILVEQCDTARNGDIVVAMINGFESEATVKTFYKEADHIRLQPENSTMSPIIVRDAKILGKVKGVFRYF